MPGRIPDMFSRLRASNRRAVMPFICGGFPGPGATAAVLPALQSAGASIVEIGIPFSDPVADGPVIAAAMNHALNAGATPLSVFSEVAAARPALTIGLVAMCSISIVHRMGGADGFCTKAAAAGFDGLIVPDITLEESAEVRSAAAARGLTCSLLVAPTSPPDRIAAIARACTGFVYLLARTGITGERQDTPDIGPLVRAIRAATDLPIACGFGISRADHVRAMTRDADAAIVGSALVRRMDDARRAGKDPVAAAADFTTELASGV